MRKEVCPCSLPARVPLYVCVSLFCRGFGIGIVTNTLGLYLQTTACQILRFSEKINEKFQSQLEFFISHFFSEPSVCVTVLLLCVCVFHDE